MSSAPLPMVTTAFIITVWPVRSKRSLRRTVCLRITSCSDAMAQLGERDPVQRLLAGDELGLVEADRGLSHGADSPIAVQRPPRGLWTLPEGVASAPWLSPR